VQPKKKKRNKHVRKPKKPPPTLWTGPTVPGLTVLVGNGPSAPQYAEEIDRADTVIRINMFPPGEAGNKWDIWWCSMSDYVRKTSRRWNLYQRAERPDRVWGLFPRRFIPADWGERVPTVEMWINHARLWALEVAISNDQHLAASSGFMAFDMVLRYRPERLAIVGFDATDDDKAPGWGHWPSNNHALWNPKGVGKGRRHSFSREKVLMREWQETRKFCGCLYPDTEPIWWRLR
jgi:hypothetical protein